MSEVKITKSPSEAEIRQARGWLIWEKEASSFPWEYEESKICYTVEGCVTVTPEGGEPVSIKAGDLVTFPCGMRGTWGIHTDIRKHNHFV